MQGTGARADRVLIVALPLIATVVMLLVGIAIGLLGRPGYREACRRVPPGIHWSEGERLLGEAGGKLAGWRSNEAGERTAVNLDRDLFPLRRQSCQLELDGRGRVRGTSYTTWSKHDLGTRHVHRVWERILSL